MTMTRETAQLGILGTGRMGVRLATMFASAGRRVHLGSRDAERARRIAAELQLPGLTGGSYDEALSAPAILPAIFIRDGMLDLLAGHAPQLKDKLIIDISNPFNEDYSDFTTPWDSSGAEELQRRVPGNVVGAFKNVFWGVFDAPSFDGLLSDVLVVGDDHEALRRFFQLVEGTPFRYLDAGPLMNARAVERLTLITGRLGRQIDAYPRMNWRLLGGGENGAEPVGVPRIEAR